MNRLRKAALVFAVVSLVSLFAWLPGTTSAQEGQGDDLQNSLVHELEELTEGKVRISTHAKTGMVRFIGTELSNPVPQPTALKASASPEDAARGFLSRYGELFGLENKPSELKVMRSKTIDGGRSFVRFQQVYEGIPIVGGELIVQVGSTENSIISANGEILPDISLDTTPTVAASSAQEAALNVVAEEYGIDPGALIVSKPELWIYNSIILGMNFDLTTLVWRMEVESVELLPIRELVLVDAHLGAIALHFNQISTAKYRFTYDAQGGSTLPGVLRRYEGQGPYYDDDVDCAHDYAGDTYDFYWDKHERDSIDGEGMSLISSVHYYHEDFCPNACWNGSQMVYCDGFPQADDVVAHEITHGVTDHTSNLFYFMQSGAINEAFSDIWGEFVDQTNEAGNDDDEVRWQIGEDEPNFGTVRDMSDPTVFGDPDKMTSSNYYCGSWDHGGVHRNSGVASKAAYLMVDGDTFNGKEVAGMDDIPKVAALWYEVQTNLFTSSSDYADLYDCLQQAAINLGYNSADRQTVKDAVDATEMNQQPTSCPITEIPPCDAAPPFDLWFDDLENTDSGNWDDAYYVGSSAWYYPQPPGWTYATSGVYNLWGYDQPSRADYYIAMTLDVTLPYESHFNLHFNHAYDFEYDSEAEEGRDGGVLEYSINGGSTWNDAGALFTDNGYNGTISSEHNNPLGGRSAFVNCSDGYISSRLDLSSLEGESVRFRFRIGTDAETSKYGWFIDDVRIYACEATPSTWHNRTVTSRSGNWNSARNGATLRVDQRYLPPNNVLSVSTGVSGTYSINRTWLNFNTPPIPEGKQITAARVGLYVTDVGGLTSSLCLTKGLVREPIDTDAWAAQTAETTDLGYLPLYDIIPGQYNWITLNQDGIDWINQSELEYKEQEGMNAMHFLNPNFYGNWRVCQTFTPRESHSGRIFKMRLSRKGSPGTLFVTIYEADENGFPIGDPLAQDSMPAGLITTDPNGYYYRFILNDYVEFEEGTEYAIVLWCSGGNSSNYLRWSATNQNCYLAGRCAYSFNGGSTWTSYPTWDMFFIEYEVTYFDGETMEVAPMVGGTNFCLRTSHDISNYPPIGTQYFWVNFHSAQAGVGYLPILELTFE
jgi:bacillolysin